jgi:MOSC domain-containing protein YiiM
MLRSLNLDGDGQADLTVHGGLDKAVYVYPFEHYDYWRGELPDTDLPPGIFGENFTTTGLREEEVNIGDRFRIGTVTLMVTQPRLPCYKLGIRFGRPDMVKRCYRWSTSQCSKPRDWKWRYASANQYWRLGSEKSRVDHRYNRLW